MATFNSTQNQPTQEHFYLVEVDLPIIIGKCEITEGIEGFGTPLSCPIQDGTSEVVIKTYVFGTNNTPLLPQSPIYKHIVGIREDATELRSGEGLAIRGGGSVTIKDFVKDDPNLERLAAQAVKDQGTFLGKWEARNVFEGKPIRVKKYRVPTTGTLSTSAKSQFLTSDNDVFKTSNGLNFKVASVLPDDAEITHYITDGIKNNGDGQFTLTFKDELSRIEFDRAQYPSNESGSLRSNITDSVASIPVDSVTDWLSETVPYVVRIENELMTVQSVSNNLTASATLNVATRGANIGTPDFTTFLSQTRKLEHSSGDEVFICELADDKNIANVLEEILLDANMPSSIIPIADWLTEIATWHPSNKISTIFYESEDSDDALLRVLQPYMLDMWYEPIDREIKLKAISEWQKASVTVTEGKEIDFQSLKTNDAENLRYSRASISFNKRFITDPEEAGSYSNGSFAVRTDLETAAFYGDSKLKRFNNSSIIDRDAGDLLCTRYVQRYGLLPKKHSWVTQERFRTFRTGDVVNISSPETQGFDGLAQTNLRAQITRIQPVLRKEGRTYRVEALTYQPAATAGGATPVFTITSGVELNLFIQAGAPPDAVTVTFILDSGLFSSTNNVIAAVRAGGFAAGSKIIIILRNAADWQGKGGNGGGSETVQNGDDGGTVYDAQGIDTDIHLGGPDPEGGTAIGFLRAPGGGGGSGRNDLTGGPEPQAIPPGGGGGGAGLDAGFGGISFGSATDGANGNGVTGLGGPGGIGETTAGDGGDGGDWGDPGTNGQSSPVGSGGTGGAAGKGIVKGGAVVKLFGDTPTNFINGIGDTPDP